MYVTGFVFLVSTLLLMWSSVAEAAALRLTWQDTSANESGFKVERASGASYVEIASVGANVQAYSDATVKSGVNYCYRVRAFNSGGVSAPTNPACATGPSGGGDGGGGGGAKPQPGTPTPPPITPPIPPAPAAGRWTDYQVRATFRSADNDSLGVMFRYQDANNYYRFSWFAEHKERRLEKRVNGVFHVLAQDTAAYSTGRTYALQISARGSSLTVVIDGKTIFSVKDTSIAQGTIALYSYRNSGSYFDDVHVQDLGTGSTLAAEDFKNGNHVGWTIIDDDDASPSKWAVRQGVLVQSSNTGSTGAKGNLGTYALYTRGNWKDYRVSAKMRSMDDDRMGVLFRLQDSHNYYRFSWDQGTPGRRLYKREKGAFKLLAEDAVPYVTNQTYKVEIVAQGNGLKVTVDGKAVFSVTDSSFSDGTIALYSCYNEGTHFDDVLVEDLDSKSVLLWEDFSKNSLAGWSPFDDEGTNLGPSNWTVSNGALVQSSNIGSDAAGHLGTFLLY